MTAPTPEEIEAILAGLEPPSDATRLTLSLKAVERYRNALRAVQAAREAAEEYAAALKRDLDEATFEIERLNTAREAEERSE